MASFASIVILLVLFWLVFSIVGLHVFGGLKLDVPWPNCDSLINSLIISFHVSAALLGTDAPALISKGHNHGMEGCTSHGLPPCYDSILPHNRKHRQLLSGLEELTCKQPMCHCGCWDGLEQTRAAAAAALLPQILNLENFQISMYSVIRATNYASSMYWLAWIILGKFIFLTLFLAVTLDAFERKYEVGAAANSREMQVTVPCMPKLGRQQHSPLSNCSLGKYTLANILLTNHCRCTRHPWLANNTCLALCCRLTSRGVFAARAWPAPCSAGSKRQGRKSKALPPAWQAATAARAHSAASGGVGQAKPLAAHRGHTTRTAATTIPCLLLLVVAAQFMSCQGSQYRMRLQWCSCLRPAVDTLMGAAAPWRTATTAAGQQSRSTAAGSA